MFFFKITFSLFVGMHWCPFTTQVKKEGPQKLVKKTHLRTFINRGACITRQTFKQAQKYCPATEEGGQEGYQSIDLAFLHNRWCLKGCSLALYFLNKPVTCLGPKKGGVFWCGVLYKKLKSALCTAATIAVAPGGVSLLPCTARGVHRNKKKFSNAATGFLKFKAQEQPFKCT